jgi:hypothetical protein
MKLTKDQLKIFRLNKARLKGLVAQYGWVIRQGAVGIKKNGTRTVIIEVDWENIAQELYENEIDRYSDYFSNSHVLVSQARQKTMNELYMRSPIMSDFLTDNGFEHQVQKKSEYIDDNHQPISVEVPHE